MTARTAPWWWPVHLAWTLLVLAWLERPRLHLACLLLDHAWAGPLCRRCEQPASMVRDYRHHTF